MALEDDVLPIKRLVSLEDEDAVIDAKDYDRYVVARAGDHLMVQFQCDLCHFRNIQRRSPEPGSVRDRLLLRCIRRANLDACWARESTTVANNTRNVKKLLEKEATIGVGSGLVMVPAGPCPLRDDNLMAVAATMMQRSLDAGKNDVHVQYDTVRQL
jgi:hypothetical protein